MEHTIRRRLVKSETVTNYVAGAGVTMPVWVHSLDQLGTLCAALVPILSVVWLVVQMYFYVRRAMRDVGEKEQ